VEVTEEPVVLQEGSVLRVQVPEEAQADIRAMAVLVAVATTQVT